MESNDLQRSEGQNYKDLMKGERKRRCCFILISGDGRTVIAIMSLPPADTPLYSHPLPNIEQWLRDQGCEQDSDQLHCWSVQRPDWRAEICLDIEQLTVRYLQPGQEGQDIQRSFKYSLSRKDIEQAVFAGP